MIILTTLKQKDLAAVSAQQLLAALPNAPSHINRFDLYDIHGTFNEHDLNDAIQHSYIFSNPNKHHLITSRTDLFQQNQRFFHVYRKEPLNLTRKVFQLNQLLANGHVQHIYASELWVFNYPTSILSQINNDDIVSHFIESTPDNHAPFAHPLIHDVTPLSLDDINQKLGALTGSNHHEA